MDRLFVHGYVGGSHFHMILCGSFFSSYARTDRLITCAGFDFCDFISLEDYVISALLRFMSFQKLIYKNKSFNYDSYISFCMHVLIGQFKSCQCLESHVISHVIRVERAHTCM